MSIHFESDHPFIAVPLECETIEDLQDRIDEILKKPYDMIAFDAGLFNGTINLSQLWNALLFIARDAEQPSVLFSCDKSKLPEMYQTDNDYATILRFAIRSALIDAVKIEGSLDEDDIDDIAGQAVDLGSVPIIVIRADQGTKADELVQKMESRWDLEAKTFELAVPVQTQEDIQALEDAAKAANVLHAKGIGTVMITLGSRGVWLSAEGESRRIPGFRLQAIDTIAAGDTFNGGLVTALLEGTALPEAIRFAHAAAAIAVTRKGAQPSVPWRTEIDEFLAQQG